MTLLISCVLITKGVKVTREGGTREFKIDEYRQIHEEDMHKRVKKVQNKVQRLLTKI